MLPDEILTHDSHTRVVKIESHAEAPTDRERRIAHATFYPAGGYWAFGEVSVFV